MIFRAIFFVAVVAVLMPREPDLGLGRPGAAAASLPGKVMSALTGAIAPGTANCRDHEMTCIAANGAASELRHTAFQSLAAVKAEIEEAKRERIASR